MAAQRAQRIGKRMRERRLELDLNQPEVADRIPVASVTKDYVSRWELGKTEPSEAYLEHIAKALETTVDDLMAGPTTERKPAGPTPNLDEVLGDDPAVAAIRSLERAVNSLRSEILDRLGALESVVEAEAAANAESRSQIAAVERSVAPGASGAN